MAKLLGSTEHRDSPNQVLRRFRYKVTRNIYWGAAASSALLALSQFLSGKFPLSIILTISSLLFIIAAMASRERLLPMRVNLGFALIIGFAVNFSILSNGVDGLYWAYPVIVSLFFLFNRKLTIIMIPLLSLSVIASAAISLPISDVWRFAVSLMMLLALGTTFVVLMTRMQRSMTYLVVTDPLTQLYNRNGLTESLNEAIANFERYHHPASMIIIDLDHFKGLNDEHGHLFGDQMLKQTATRLQQCIRANDLLFRVGGEEFLLVLPNTNQREAKLVAEKLLSAIRSKPYPGKTATVTLTASAGVAELLSDQQWSQWLTAADTALFEAKNSGRDKVRLAGD